MNKETKLQVKTGAIAITNYYNDLTFQSIDELISQDKLNDVKNADFIKSYLSNAKEILASSNAEKLELLNNNEYISWFVEQTELFIENNKEELLNKISDLEDNMGFKFSEVGLNEDLYFASLYAAKEKGLFGNGSLLGVLSDSIMKNLDLITEKVYTNMKEDGAIDAQIEQVLDILGNKLKLTVPGVQKAYEKGGFIGERTSKWFDDGVIKYALDYLVENGSEELAPYLGMLPMMGLEHNITPESIRESYAKNGLLKKDGVLQSAIMDLYTSSPAASGMAYNMFAQQIVKQKMDKEVKAWGEKHTVNRFMVQIAERSGQVSGHYKSKTERDVALQAFQLDLQEKYMAKLNSVMMNGLPEALKAENIKSVYENAKGGFMGADGVISYITKNLKDIVKPFVDVGLIDEKESLDSKSKVSVNVKGKDFGIEGKDFTELVNGFINYDGEMTVFQKLAYNLVDKANELGVKPDQLLSDKTYKNDLGAVYRYAYGDDLKSLNNIVSGIDTYLKMIPEMRTEIFSDNVEEELQDGIEDFLSENSTLGERFLGTMLSPLKEEGFVNKMKDYLTVSQAMMSTLKNEYSSIIKDHTI